MKANFASFETIKKVLDENNRKITKFTDLSLLYLGFCQHFIAYIEAYETLFRQKNYYACYAIDRIMIDLYLKTRLLAEVENPEDLADWLWKGEKIEHYRSFSAIKGNLTATALCKYFDEQDYTYPCCPGKKEKINKTCQGMWEYRYKKMCDFVHPQ